ncbi:hypothetical protein IWZ00DRAFT_130450 [Phyllosticta capitalensis]
MNRDVQSSMSFLAIVVCVSRPVRFSLVVVCNVQLARMRGFHHPLLTQKGPLHFVVHKANKSDSKSSVPQLCIHMVIWLVSFRKLRPSTSSSSRIQSSPVQSADRPLHQPARQTDRHRAPSPRSLTNASICCCSASLRPLFSTHRSHQTRINKSRPTLARPPGSRFVDPSIHPTPPPALPPFRGRAWPVVDPPPVHRQMPCAPPGPSPLSPAQRLPVACRRAWKKQKKADSS